MNTPKIEGLQADTCGQILQLLKKAYPFLYEAFLACESSKNREEFEDWTTDIEDALHYLMVGMEKIDPEIFVESKDHAES